MVMATETPTAQHLVEYTNDGIPYGIQTIITEAAGPMSVEPMLLRESAQQGYIKELADGRFRVFAKAQHCGVKNRNGRIYPIPTWEQHLREGCDFMRRIGVRGVIGHLEHPDDGKSKMPLAAVLVTEAKLDRETGEIWIVFETLSTPPGRVVEAYVRDCVRFGLSSRGNGSVVNEMWQPIGERVDVVQDDYEPITWDVVIDESTPGAEVPASKGLREALDGLRSYLKRLDERSGGDASAAKRLLREDTQKAVGAIDCEGGVCACQISESAEPLVIPPSGYSRYLLAFEDGSGHYRAYQGTAGQWEVWLHPHNLGPERLGTKIPTLAAAQQVAENHYSLVLAGGAVSAQQQAANSNAIGMQANSPGMAGAPMAGQVLQPNISGMAGQMGRYSGPVGPGPQTSRAPKVVVSFESLEHARAAWPDRLAKLQEKWSTSITVPYSGSAVAISGLPQELNGILEAVKTAGLPAVIEGSWVKVFTTYENATQAAKHVQRVLEGKSFKQNKVRAVAAIRAGRITEDNMTINTRGRRVSALNEYAPDKSASGSMAGGDTLPDDSEEPDGISPEYRGEDPENIDLDTDVNEMSPLDYDYADDDDGMSYDDMGMSPDMGDDMGMGYDEPEMEMSYKPMEMGPDDMGDDDMGDDDMGEPEMECGGGYAMEADDSDDDDEDDDDTENESMKEAYARFGLTEKGPPGDWGKGKGKGGARKAFFGKMLGKTGKTITGKKAVAGQKRRLAKYAADNNLKISGGIQQPDRKAKKKKDEMHAMSFTRIVAETEVGAVRVWVNEAREPVRYEFYGATGMLESITDALGNVIHKAMNEGAGSHCLHDGEVWRSRRGKMYEAASIIRTGIDAASIHEEELKGRDGASTGVVTKGSEWQGKKGPEYSMTTMNKPGDRGQEGDGGKEGDYDKASEEGDGEFMESIAVVNLRSENARLREKVEFLEGELSRYEDIVQEQHEIIRESDEARERESLGRYRAEALARYPELSVVETTLKRCESVQELEEQINTCLSLVETVQSRNPAPEPEQTSVLAERFDRPRNGISSHGVSAAPMGPLNESSTPFVDGPRGGGDTSVIGGGNTASRVAAHRKRRRSR